MRKTARTPVTVDPRGPYQRMVMVSQGTEFDTARFGICNTAATKTAPNFAPLCFTSAYFPTPTGNVTLH